MRMLKLVLLITFLGCGMTLFAQSVADAAKMKPAKKATRVITNDEIPSRPQEEEPPAGEATSGPSSAKTNAETTPAARESSDVKEMQIQLAEMNKNITARQKRTDEYRGKMQNETDDHRREVEQEVLAAMEGELKSMQEEAADLQKKIDEKKQAENEKATTTAETKEPASE